MLYQHVKNMFYDLPIFVFVGRKVSTNAVWLRYDFNIVSRWYWDFASTFANLESIQWLLCDLCCILLFVTYPLTIISAPETSDCMLLIQLLWHVCLKHQTLCSEVFLAEIPLRSPRKSFILTIYKKMFFGSKYPKKDLIKFWKKLRCFTLTASISDLGFKGHSNAFLDALILDTLFFCDLLKSGVT